MTGTDQSFSSSTLTFGAFPRRLVVAVILEGLTLFGFLQFTSSGLIDSTILSRFLPVVVLLGCVAVILTFFFARRISANSYSPILHRPFVPNLIASGYLLLGCIATSIGFVIQLLLVQEVTSPLDVNLIFGLSLGAIFGFLILMYIDRFEVNHPGNREKLERTINSILNCRSGIEESNKAPIKLTSSFDSLIDLMAQASAILEKSSTVGGRKLAIDAENWLEAFQGKPEVSQASIVDRTRNPEQQELTELKDMFESIIERLERISNYE